MDRHGVSRELREQHKPSAIRRRLSAPRVQSLLGDAVLGGIDGCVTTFAVVAGAAGGELSHAVIVVLGFANLAADGFSMAASNYLSVKSRREEEAHIALYPRGEREEVRQIFRRKGFKGAVLEEIVEVITRDDELWIRTMLSEEHGLALEDRRPLQAGLATFAAFLAVGLMPLLPFLAPALSAGRELRASAAITALAFFGVGVLKGRILRAPLLRSGLETLALGGAAAALAYAAGHALRRLYG